MSLDPGGHLRRATGRASVPPMNTTSAAAKSPPPLAVSSEDAPFAEAVSFAITDFEIESVPVWAFSPR